jgi:hypothetical protein
MSDPVDRMCECGHLESRHGYTSSGQFTCNDPLCMCRVNFKPVEVAHVALSGSIVGKGSMK